MPMMDAMVVVENLYADHFLIVMLIRYFRCMNSMMHPQHLIISNDKKLNFKLKSQISNEYFYL